MSTDEKSAKARNGGQLAQENLSALVAKLPLDTAQRKCLQLYMEKHNVQSANGLLEQTPQGDICFFDAFSDEIGMTRVLERTVFHRLEELRKEELCAKPEFVKTRLTDQKYVEFLDDVYNQPAKAPEQIWKCMAPWGIDPEKAEKIRVDKVTAWENTMRAGSLQRQHPEACSMIYMNTLEDLGLNKVWRDQSKWQADRQSAIDGGAANGDLVEAPLEKVLPFVVKLDQSLGVLQPMKPCVAYRYVAFTYPDFEERFEKDRDDLTWFEPKSCTHGPRAEGVVKQFYENQGKKMGTVFIINNFQGVDVKGMSAIPDEEEAMTRGLQKFKVKSATRQTPFPDSNPFCIADVVELDWMPTRRREPVKCRELTQEALTKYAHHVQQMKQVAKYYSENFTFEHFTCHNAERSEITELRETMPLFKDMPGPTGSELVYLHTSTAAKEEGKMARFCAKTTIYSQAANGNFDCIVVAAEQQATFCQITFEALLKKDIAKAAAQFEIGVRDEKGTEVGDFRMSLFGSDTPFWKGYDSVIKGTATEKGKRKATIEANDQKREQEALVFENVLTGYIISTLREKNLIRLEGDKIRVLT